MIRLLRAGFIKGISLSLGICVYIALSVICVCKSIPTQKTLLAFT